MAKNENSAAPFRDVSIDAVARFWDGRPCNVRHSLKPVGTKEYFDDVEARKYRVEPHIPGFAEFERWRGKKVLEIGCGIGTDTVNFARNGAHVTAVDLSSESLALAKRRAAVFGLEERITFIHANAEDLQSKIPDDSFDLVYSFGVIHHTPHPERVLAAVKPLMRSHDSELRLMVYSRVSFKLFWIMHQRNQWRMKDIDQLIARDSEAQSGCPVTYSYTFEGARELLSAFHILEMRKAHIFTWDIESYIRHEWKKDAIWEGVSDAELLDLERELGWHLLIRATIR